MLIQLGYLEEAKAHLQRVGLSGGNDGRWLRSGQPSSGHVVSQTDILFVSKSGSYFSSMSLNLDDYAAENTPAAEPSGEEGFVDKAIAEGVEEEKCVIAAYRTSEAQTKSFRKVLEDCNGDRSRIPVEWVIDIADESNGWFYGTAYHYDDVTGMLHVMVPDKLNPTFDGYVPLDHRTVHLIECVDKSTDALFNKIVRDSVVKVRWEVDWYEEHEGDGSAGRWIMSTARFLVRIANQLLVEDEDFGQDTKGFVMLTADHNLRLRKCIKGKGQEDFRRLITETLVQSTPDALESLDYDNAGPTTPNPHAATGNLTGSSAIVPIRKIADMSKSLREHFHEIIDEREALADQRLQFAERFSKFVQDGDLDAGMILMDSSEQTLLEAEDTKSPAQEHADQTVEKAWNLCNRMERSLAQVLKSNKHGGGQEETFRRRRDR